MAFASIAGIDALELLLALPRRGVWTCDALLDAATPPSGPRGDAPARRPPPPPAGVRYPTSLIVLPSLEPARFRGA